MEVRQSTKNDISSIMNIINQAQASFKKHGINQWQNNYPNLSVIENDIELDESYVILMDNNIVGTFVLSFRIESSYNIIYDGAWLSNLAYAVIHRIAFDESIKGKGFSKFVLDHIYTLCLKHERYSIRIDTHEDNQIMRHMLVSNGFILCGTIFLIDGNKRLAYERLLK